MGIPKLALNPYFGIEHKVIVIPCQSKNFPLSYAVIATIVLLLFHYFFIAWIPTSFFKFVLFNVTEFRKINHMCTFDT